ncbi:POXA3b laccase small subunit [Mycena sp. CBHHK59/15]|nr:POXA3b laccase small subunit [Mycena sp. CBHHK59/15]
MFALSRLFALAALVSVACAQATNTNAAINSIVDSLDENLHSVGPTILTLQANHTLNPTTLAKQMASLTAAFNKTATSLAATSVSSGSTTVDPTNDDISITYSDTMQLTASSLSGIVGTGAVPNFSTMVATLDPIVAKASTQLNTTLPGSIALVHTMMLDASQFLRAEGFNLTLVALGFTV